ncbi:MAG: transposon-transfer assisting family protein [Zoogloeaceae bacterium]|nr:transposon-transfer assisting family protein [Zoogloeaceae bacterium]
MKPSAVRLQLSFDFQLSVPEALASADADVLQRTLTEALGTMVLQGLPTIAAKQLARSGITIERHSCAVAASDQAPAVEIDRALLVAAAPHLTDDELRRLAGRVLGKLPATPDEQFKAVRRHALALANEFRLVPGVVHAVLTSEQPGTLDATINLTNGSVMIESHDRQKRLLPGQHEVAVEVPGAGLRLKASYAGHTISGPVIEVPIAELAGNRDALVGLWQQAS